MFSEKNGRVYRFATFTVDAGKRSLTRGNEPLSLTPKAFDLLVVLLQRPGEVVTKEELLQRVWPGHFVEEGNLTVHVASIRKVLGETKKGKEFIATVPGRGYQFVGEIASDEPDYVIEEISISRITVEHDGAQAGPTNEIAARTLTPGRSMKLSVPLLIGAAAVALAVLSFFGYRTYRAKRVWSADLGSEKTSKQLTAAGNVSSAAMSRDGRSIVYQTFDQGNFSLWYGSVSGGRTVQVVPPNTTSFDGLSFSPSGDAVFFVKNDSLFKMATLGGPPQMVIERIPPAYSLSADAKRVAYVTTDQERKTVSLMIADVENGQRYELAGLPADRGFSRYPAWSPDGARLAIGVASEKDPGHFKISSVDVADGRITTVDPQPWEQITKTAWLPDGTGIVFHAVGDRSNYHIWLVDYPSGSLRCLTDDLSRYGRASLAVSDDGTELLLVRDEGDSSIYSAPAGDTRHLNKATTGTLGKWDGSDGLGWTADNRIVYSSFFDKGLSIWIVDPADGNAKQLTPSGYSDRFPSATADGKYIVFQTSRNGGKDIWRINSDGSDLRPLTADGKSSFPALMPDGRSLLFVTGETLDRSIWKMSIDGGTPVRLTASPSDFPVVSPDGRFFACIDAGPASSGGQLAVFPIDGGSAIHRFKGAPGSTFNNGLHWLPDGSAIVYRDFAEGLWHQPLSGGPPEKMPDIPAERIYFFDWSRDGRQFAMSYGSEFRDVVLVTNFH